MGCCLIAGILAASPRLVLFGMWIFGYLSQASIGWIWGFLGFLFLPCTTMGYAIAQNAFGGLSGWGAVFFALGIVLDILIYYGGGRSRTQYSAAA